MALALPFEAVMKKGVASDTPLSGAERCGLTRDVREHLTNARVGYDHFAVDRGDQANLHRTARRTSGGRREEVRVIAKRLAIAGAVATVTCVCVNAGSEPAAIRTTGEARHRYLAHAIIWQTPKDLSPANLLQGPPDVFPFATQQATSDSGVSCAFLQGDGALGGASPKFLCRTADGRDLRLKYWDPERQSGNREVFATVAASRLLWALGFNAVPAMSMNVTCDNCPENPATGTGPRRSRRYVAALQALWPTPSILSIDDPDQGWSWRELDAAIRSLPTGAERTRQRTHFDALTLLGAFIQHGDRKHEQQRLYCAAPIDMTAQDLRSAGSGALMLLERPGIVACPSSAVEILDVGLTFGGAGRTSNDRTAAMDLAEWQDKPVFKTTESGECRGQLTVSFSAGGGESNPRISEEGRLFLLAQLRRLTPNHVRAIFEAARIDQLERPSSTTTAAARIDAWAAAFAAKVRQVEAKRCRSDDGTPHAGPYHRGEMPMSPEVRTTLQRKQGY